jgi:DNA-binding NtrC family response regulator
MSAKAVVLVVDDDSQIRTLVRTLLTHDGHDVIEAADADEALRRMDESLPDLLLCDVVLPNRDGLGLIQEARKRDPSLPLLMMSGRGSIDTAVQAMRHGAGDFISKPFDLERFRAAVRKSLSGQVLRRELLRMRSDQGVRHGPENSVLIGSSLKMAAVFRTIKQVARSPATTVLIQGESGTGKELVARAVHFASERRAKKFVEINCAALTESLLEAELFGYEKGAFTGAASTGKPGLFEVAHGGTIFLDEIGEMTLPFQAKFLRVLQEKRFKRVGGIEDVEVDVRIIASTNRDLETLVHEGQFRLDLYYRLRVIPILVPPLRERVDDIIPIATHFIDLFSRELAKTVSGLTPAAATALQMHPWPGNVRELRNVIERAVIMAPGDEIDVDALLFGAAPKARNAEAIDLGTGSIVEMERRLISRVLDSTSWRRADAARILGINRTTLYNKIREYQLAPAVGA